jgi:putative pyruvate formate lyase activating enzyme
MSHNALYSLYAHCEICPRRCGVNRLDDTTGYCGETALLRIASASIHHGEEPPLRGTGGSGTIFVSGCNLGCVFCQNYRISLPGRGEQPLGRAVDTGEFVKICLALQERGAENINIVTGSHTVPALAEGLGAAKSAGLRIPVLWNSSAYELPETLELLSGLVDVFLPDLKTLDRDLAVRYFTAPDYPEIAPSAIQKMLELGKTRKGEIAHLSATIVRHLVLPGHLDSTREVLRWFAEHCTGMDPGPGPSTLLSLMFQYTPVWAPNRPCTQNPQGPEIPDRGITEKEYGTVLGWLSEFGIEDGFCQELNPGTDWLPDFNRENPFPSDLSLPLWHWRAGFLD